MSDWAWGSWTADASSAFAEEFLLSLVYDFERERGRWNPDAGTSEAVSRKYAETRRAAADATRIARTEYAGDRHRTDGAWMQRAQSDAVAHLSPLDEVFVDLMVEACVWCADRGDLGRLRGVLASTTSDAAAVHGPRSDAAKRLRDCWSMAQIMVYNRTERAVDSAHLRLAQAERKTGPVSAAALKATWKLIDRYQDAFKSDLLVRLVERKHAELTEAHGADHTQVVGFARAAAAACHDVGRPDVGARLHEQFYRWRLHELGSTEHGTDTEKFAAVEAEIQAELAMSEMLQPAGQPVRAERLARRAVGRLGDLMDLTRSRKDYRRVDAVRHEAHFQLGATLLQNGRRAEAHRAFREAFFYLSPGGLENPPAPQYYNTMVFTGDRWRN